MGDGWWRVVVMVGGYWLGHGRNGLHAEEEEGVEVPVTRKHEQLATVEVERDVVVGRGGLMCPLSGESSRVSFIERDGGWSLSNAAVGGSRRGGDGWEGEGQREPPSERGLGLAGSAISPVEIEACGADE